MVGFDMDYTLALYNQARIEELSMRATLHKLVTAKGYPAAIQALAYDPMLAVRGLVVDHVNGNIFKPDRYGFPGRARHGLADIDRTKVRELYQRERMRLSNNRYAWIDSLFALPEAVLYACLVEYFDRQPETESKPSYSTLWEHIRECIDLAHRDGSIKAIVSEHLVDYVERDEGLAETLHKFRSSGKRLFLLTNSAWDYTSPGDELSARRRARRVSVVAQLLRRDRGQRRQAGVLHRGASVHRAGHGRHAADPIRGQGPRCAVPARARSTPGGNIKTFQTRARASGDRVLFVGDHIYGDMLRSRKSSNWRTAMVLQELEHEVSMYDRLRPELAGLDRLDAELVHLDSELNERQRRCARCRSCRPSRPTGDKLSAAKRTVKDSIEKLRRDLRAAAVETPRRRGGDRRRLQPLLGPDLPRGLRGQQVRRTGRGLRLRLHQPRLQLPLLLADAVLPRPARPHAARTLDGVTRTSRLSSDAGLFDAEQAGGGEVDGDADEDRDERLEREDRDAGRAGGAGLDARATSNQTARAHHGAGEQDAQQREQQVTREQAFDLGLEDHGEHDEVGQRGDRRAEREADVAQGSVGGDVPERGWRRRR